MIQTYLTYGHFIITILPTGNGKQLTNQVKKTYVTGRNPHTYNLVTYRYEQCLKKTCLEVLQQVKIQLGLWVCTIAWSHQYFLDGKLWIHRRLMWTTKTLIRLQRCVFCPESLHPQGLKISFWTWLIWTNQGLNPQWWQT